MYIFSLHVYLHVYVCNYTVNYMILVHFLAYESTEAYFKWTTSLIVFMLQVHLIKHFLQE